VIVDEPSLGAGNVLSWLRNRGEDLTCTRLQLDRAWMAPDGSSLTSFSLATLLSAAASYRRMFRDIGVRAGDVVVMRIGTPISVYLSWVALAAEGAIAAPVNPNFSDDGVRDYARHVAAVGYLIEIPADTMSAAELSWHSRSQPEDSKPVTVRPGVDALLEDADHQHRPDEIVLLCHTSGTTGRPKAVSCSHHGFMAGIRSQMREPACPLFGATMLNALPAAHHSWFMTITWALLSGTRLIIAANQSARTLVEDVRRFEPDSIRSFSCTLREVARLGLAQGALRSVGLWMTTGDASRRRDIATVCALGTHPVATSQGISRAPGMFVLDGFGSTELGHLHFSLLHAPGRVNEARCIGRPASFARAAILDEEGRELAENQVGYLAVRSDAVTPGYWNEPERTAQSRLGGFWITGDVGYRDSFGRYFHLDRRSDVIDTPEGQVFSVRIEEELLHGLPEIERCAVVACRQEDGGVRVVCLVESDDRDRASRSWNVDVNAVLARASLAPIAETVVLPRGTLPLGPTGKIRKFMARAQLGHSAAV
jgi:acyl-coenzyme A synthetase/AMP-(fatty) acid ligase